MKNKLSRWFKSALVGLHALLFVGCGATLADSMPRAASGIEASKDLYLAACEPKPVVSENVCEASKAGINDVIDFYTEVNEAL